MHRLVLSITLAAALAAPTGPLDRVWAAFSTLWGAPASPKAGCEWDPDGRCLKTRTKAGCEWDPFGRCLADRAEAGCELDPDGRCNPISTKAGCEWDPSGKPRCS